MELPFKHNYDLKKLELRAATVMYILAVIFLIPKISNQGFLNIHAPNSAIFENKNLEYSFFANYFFPQFFRYTLAFGSFILLSLYIVPSIIKKEKLVLQIFLVIVLYLLNGLIFGTTDTWLKTYDLAEYDDSGDGYAQFFQTSFIYIFWLFLLFAFYSVVKYFAYAMMAKAEKEQDGRQVIIRDGLTGLMFWMISSILILNTYAGREFIAFWMLMIPFALALYTWSLYKIIPRIKAQNKGFWRYWGELWIIICLSLVPVFIISLAVLSYNGDGAVAINAFNAMFQLCVTAPLSWYLFKYRTEKQSEIWGLKTALGKSTADLDFLRSQINPHFLFNAMNTLYGTALQEQAERTSEGIQKLSEMMRFMLQENMQNEILLNREMDYLKNYISLQKLRTQASPDIRIETELEEHISALKIAPMLLIPFVENAFKHGISLREPSHIRIAVHTTNQTLYFDVSNSIHIKPDNDPEKIHSGIGLENVKQRLQLLYPQQHDLTIRETGREYFVHLTIILQ